MSKYTASEFDDLASSLSSITAPDSPVIDDGEREFQFSRIIHQFSDKHDLNQEERGTLIFLARSLNTDKGRYVLSDRRLHEDCGDAPTSKDLAIVAFDAARFISKSVEVSLNTRDITYASELRLKTLRSIVEIENGFTDLKEKVIQELILTDGVSNNKIGVSAGMQHQSIGLRRTALKASLQEAMNRDDLDIADCIGRRVSILPSENERYLIREVSDSGHVTLVNEIDGTIAESSLAFIALA